MFLLALFSRMCTICDYFRAFDSIMIVKNK
jgi:hypothetical protein